jgi:hypothetical protein
MLSPRGSEDYNRFKYYSALKTGYKHLGERDDFLNIPRNIVPEDNPYLVKVSFGCKNNLTILIRTF